MSIHAPEFSSNTSDSRFRIVIVASLYNSTFVDALIEEAQKEIRKSAPKALVELVRVPGAFEIPLAVKLVAEEKKPDAIIALGVIIRGETAHADLIAGALSDQLLELSLHYLVPVIHEVLLLNNEEQAAARCFGKNFNRGAEAAQAALAMIQIKQSLQLH